MAAAAELALVQSALHYGSGGGDRKQNYPPRPHHVQLTYKVIFLAAVAAVPAWRKTIPTAPLFIFSAYVPLLLAVMPWKYAMRCDKERPAGAGQVGEHAAAAASAGGRKEE